MILSRHRPDREPMFGGTHAMRMSLAMTETEAKQGEAAQSGACSSSKIIWRSSAMRKNSDRMTVFQMLETYGLQIRGSSMKPQ